MKQRIDQARYSEPKGNRVQVMQRNGSPDWKAKGAEHDAVAFGILDPSHTHHTNPHGEN